MIFLLGGCSTTLLLSLSKIIKKLYFLSFILLKSEDF